VEDCGFVVRGAGEVVRPEGGCKQPAEVGGGVGLEGVEGVPFWGCAGEEG
jgi:hypothetical protein